MDALERRRPCSVAGDNGTVRPRQVDSESFRQIYPLVHRHKSAPASSRRLVSWLFSRSAILSASPAWRRRWPYVGLGQTGRWRRRRWAKCRDGPCEAHGGEERAPRMRSATFVMLLPDLAGVTATAAGLTQACRMSGRCLFTHGVLP